MLQICFKFNNPEAMKQAMTNVEKFFPVVGVTENINMTLRVMEEILPEYFKGALNTYLNEEYVIKNRNQNKYKRIPSKETLKMIQHNFTHEIEFYDFCKMRLQNQFNNLSQ